MKMWAIMKWIILVAVIVVGLSIHIFYSSFNDHTYVVTVIGKKQGYVDNRDNYGVIHFNMIYGQDNEGTYYSFVNREVPLRGKFNYSIFQNQIEIGKMYKFTVVGYMQDENIIKFEKIY